MIYCILAVRLLSEDEGRCECLSVMLAAKWSAGVAPEVNLRNPLCPGDKARKKAGLETPRSLYSVAEKSGRLNSLNFPPRCNRIFWPGWKSWHRPWFYRKYAPPPPHINVLPLTQGAEACLSSGLSLTLEPSDNSHLTCFWFKKFSFFPILTQSSFYFTCLWLSKFNLSTIICNYFANDRYAAK